MICDLRYIRIATIDVKDDERFCIEINDTGNKVFLFRETRMSLDHLEDLRDEVNNNKTIGTPSPYTEEEFEAFREWSTSPDEGTVFPMDVVAQVIDGIRRANKIKAIT